MPREVTALFYRFRKYLSRLRYRKKDGSRRAEDMSAETELGRFLDRYLYDRFPGAEAFSAIERVRDREQQLAGVDVIFRGTDGRTFRVDEKAQLYYINRGLPTFAFELEYLRRGSPADGWLFREGLETDLYMLIWPYARQDSPRGIRAEDFTRAECLLVRKTEVLRLLESRGLFQDRLLWDAALIRREGTVGKIPIPGVSGIYYYASDPGKYAEAPISVIVSRRLLMGIRQRSYTVTPERVETG